MKDIHILSCAINVEGGGVYKCSISNSGKVSIKKHFACDRPMYAVKDRDNIHLLLRAPFSNSENSGYMVLSNDFSKASDIKNTLGKCACHLAVDSDVYIVNYLSGNVVKNCEKVVKHTGRGVNKDRQDAPHTHYVGFSGDKRILLVTDLGLDKIYLYDRDLNCKNVVNTLSGFGIRHLVICENKKRVYGVNELCPSVCVYDYGDTLECIKTIELNCKENSTGAAIRLDEKYNKLYVSVRGENAVFVIDLEDNKNEVVRKIQCGDSPRDIFLLDNFLLTACEKGNEVEVFDISSDKIIKTDSIKLNAPLCIF